MAVASASERLTYLLGICVAVIGWSVGQLSSNISSIKILSYEITRDGTTAPATTNLKIENIGPKLNTGEFEVLFLGTANDCIVDIDQMQIGVSYIGDNEPSRSAGGARWTVDSMPSGAGYIFSAKHKPNCSIRPTIKPSNPEVRLLATGLESIIIKNQFAIFLALIVVFSLVFITTYALSLGRGQ